MTAGRYTNVSRYRPAHPCERTPHDYRDSPTEIELVHPDRSGVIAGSARRTGVTAPGTPERAVYRLGRGWEGARPLDDVPPGSLWVYEGGAFVEIEDWHRANAPGGPTP